MAQSARRGVLFDVDGTLVDTTYLHTVSWWQAFRQFDLDVAMARIHRAIGMGADHIIDHLLGADRDRSNDDAIVAAHATLQAPYWPRLRRTAGANDLLTECHRRDLRIVLASSAGGDELAALRRAIDADDVIDTVTTADDAAASKPSPDIVQVALTKSGIPPEHAAFVGDAVWDVYACAKAGIPCIALACGGTSEAELREAGAIEVYDDPAALLASLDRSLLRDL
jgi:HAD superfamily hydrolase (TIGR01509 family)